MASGSGSPGDEKMAIDNITSTKMEGEFFRMVSAIHRNEILSMRGSLEHGGRYNVKNVFGALYLGKSPQVCQEEMRRGKKRTERMLLAKVKVSLRRVLDLTDDKILSALGVEREALMRAQDYEPTRRIAKLARDSGIEGLVVPSVTQMGSNLVIFMDKLLPDSKVRVLKKKRV